MIQGSNPPGAGIWLKLEMKFQPQLLFFFLLLLQLDLRPHVNDRKSESGEEEEIDADVDDDIGDDEFPGHLRREKRKFCAGEKQMWRVRGSRDRRREEGGGRGGGDSSGWPAALQHSPKQLIHFMYRDQKEE